MVSPSLDEELEPGRVIERHEIKRLLGAGAMAAVYLVQHTTLGSEHALKLLTWGRGRKIKERMIQEGRNQARLEHPNIVRVFDVFHVDGMPALLMEYVPGPNLEEYLEQNPPSLAEAEQIFRGIVAGVSAAHAAGLVHRDLKPANILVQLGPSGPVPKVADFGLAKAWEDEDAVSHTRAGVAMGTPQYMAPEQATNAKDVDHRADVFALGCILFELVCGRRAFEGENLPTIFNLVLSGDYPPPGELNPDLPHRLRTTIDACLDTDKDRRPQSCDAILATLSGVDAPSVDPVADLGPSDPPSAALGASGPPAPPAGDETVELAEPERPPAPASPAPMRSGGAWMWVAALGLPALVGATGLVMLGVLGAAWMAWPAASPGEDLPLPDVVDGPCPGPRGEVVGYAWAGSDFAVKPGETWVVDKDRNVRRDYPSEANGHDARTEVVCVLRKGTRVRLEAPLLTPSRSVWVPVVAGSVEP